MQIAEPALFGSLTASRLAVEEEEELLPVFTAAKTEAKHMGSKSSLKYESLIKENWSVIIPYTLIFICIGIIVLLILQLFFNFNITAQLCVVIFFTVSSMIAFGPVFLKDIGIFVMAAIITTLILTAFIYLLYDLLRKEK